MATGRWDAARQEELFVAAYRNRALGNPFYGALDRLLEENGFDDFAEEACGEFYAGHWGRRGFRPACVFAC